MAKILIVDDAMFMRETLKQMLEAHGHVIVGEAEEGNEAIQKFVETQPDLVILDITMPGMDGIEALQQIRQRDRKAKVIICSALGQQEIVAQAIVYGAEDFIVKPFEVAQLVAAVEKVLKQKENRG